MRTLESPIRTSGKILLVLYPLIYFSIMGVAPQNILIFLLLTIPIIYFFPHLFNTFIFPLFFPKYRGVFPYFNEPYFLDKTPEEQGEDLEKLYRLPNHTILTTFINTTVTMVLLGTVTLPFTSSTVFFYFLTLLIVFIPIVMRFTSIELHDFLTTTVQRLHQKKDLSEAFKKLPSPQDAESQSLVSEYLSLPLFMGTFVLQFLVLFSHEKGQNMGAIIAVLLVGMSLWAYMYILEKKALIKAVAELDKSYATIGQEKQYHIPPSSSPYIGKFQWCFNNITRKIKDYEKQVIALMVKESEESRFRTIGEISAMVGHDLKGPIHGLYFSIDSIKEEAQKGNIDSKTLQRHMEYLEANAQRMEELSTNLNSNIRNDSKEPKYTHLSLAHKRALELLKYEFTLTSHIKFDTKIFRSAPMVKVSQRDLVHAIYNLYKNSINHFKEHHIPSPQIKFSLIETADEWVSFLYQDNGLGIKKQDYHNFIGTSFDNTKANLFEKGFGLRMTKMIIDRNQGSMDYAENNKEKGVAFLIKFPKNASLNRAAS